MLYTGALPNKILGCLKYGWRDLDDEMRIKFPFLMFYYYTINGFHEWYRHLLYGKDGTKWIKDKLGGNVLLQ